MDFSHGRSARTACRFEPLEKRFLLSVAPALGQFQLDFHGETSSYFSGAESAPLGDATPAGESYMLIDHWGGSWSDAEKSPANSEDDYMCWAAAASNVLEWAGWGNVAGMTTTDDAFAYFQDHWTDDGGLMEFGWDWWFDGTSGSQGWSGWSQVDVPGGAFYPSETFGDYFHNYQGSSQSLATIDSYLHSGYGVTLGIYGPGGHAITCWGVNYNPDNPSDYHGIWVTDSDDAKYTNDAPDQLRYYEVENTSDRWYLQDYYGSDSWYIDLVSGLEPTETTPAPDPEPDPEPEPQANEIHGTVWNDSAWNDSAWNDSDGDGRQDAGEGALANQLVFLDLNNNGTHDRGTVTVASTDMPQNIPDSATTNYTLIVAGAGGSISDVNVTLDITHNWADDLDVYLISPDGTRVELFTDVGGWGANFSGTTLDDEASVAVTQGQAPFAGTFRPEGSLADFDGEDPNDTWSLEITDDEAWFDGTLNSWSLEITADEQSVSTGADGSFVFTGLADGAYRVAVQVPDGWTQTTPQDACHSLDLQEGAVAENVDFGLTEQAQLPEATDLGTVDFAEIVGLDLGAADYWYVCQAARDGFLTVEALFEGADAAAGLTLYDGNFNQLATADASTDGQRLDWNATAGEAYYFGIAGDKADVDLRVANLVSQDGDTVTVHGTDGDDRFDFAAGSYHQVTVNGVHYEFASSTVTSFSFDGNGGDNDTAVMSGSAGDDNVKFHPNKVTLGGAGYSVQVRNTRDIIVDGAGGTDVAKLYDSAGDDTFTGRPDYSELSGDGFSLQANNFRYVHCLATAGGTDSARLHDSAGNDTFKATPDQAILYGDGFYNRVKGFDSVEASATAGGTDVAKLYDSAGDDTFEATPIQARLYGDGFSLQADNFRYVHCLATAGGTDVARLYDSAGSDIFKSGQNCAKLFGDGFYNRVKCFEEIYAHAGSGGRDKAYMHDSAGDDRFEAGASSARLANSLQSVAVMNFYKVKAFSLNGGTDTKHTEATDFALSTYGSWLDT